MLDTLGVRLCGARTEIVLPFFAICRGGILGKENIVPDAANNRGNDSWWTSAVALIIVTPDALTTTQTRTDFVRVSTVITRKPRAIAFPGCRAWRRVRIVARERVILALTAAPIRTWKVDVERDRSSLAIPDPVAGRQAVNVAFDCVRRLSGLRGSVNRGSFAVRAEWRDADKSII